ncbi:MAG: hypothetical protein HW407_421 [Bacteroidetes bacterium]|nr:hypothetical protein [Bacteroidota bacterium]
MYRAVRNIALILLASLVVTGARAASICETVRLKWPPMQPEMSASFGHSKDATKESYTQGCQTWLVKQISSSPVYPCVVESAGCDTEFFLLFDLRSHLFGSSFYFSSLCNKAPPAA